jgi:hypothetical protein
VVAITPRQSNDGYCCDSCTENVVFPARIDKADLVLDGDERLSLNATNFRTLFKAYGDDPVDWIGKPVDLFASELPFKAKCSAASACERSTRPRRKSGPLLISAKSIPEFNWASVSRNERTTALVAWSAERPMELF